ncbi:YncE family protein [Kitasatospora kifunensis]|uniref:DNA-binding beta-propeller fold protein YncE n=1 Tax=Kitasatospora kifunensis TaxID=58351 RepID=A0A7W7VUL1_KITKI|nr:YncE family protein [Kitasatospora kifunensis]MBB4922769.1 DNA-binding beta-propeller fold protein YncE [Kitasatospora kifunensis]
MQPSIHTADHAHQAATVRAGKAGDVLAVVSQSGPTVSFFDAASDQLLDTVEVLAEPHEICFDPTQRLLWCASTYNSGYYNANSGRRSEVTVIDADSRRIVEVVDLAPEHAPHGLALDPVRGRLYVSVEGSESRPGGVVVIDTTTRRPIGRIDTGAPGPHWFVISPDGRAGYASNKEAPFVSVVDLERGELTAKVEVPGSEGLAISADGSRVFVAAPHGAFGGRTSDDPPAGIRVIDTGTASITGILSTENAVLPVHVTTTGKLLVGELRVTPEGRQEAGRLTVFSVDGQERLGSIEVGQAPLTITSSADGALGYVSCLVSSTVDVIELDTMRRLARLDIATRGETGAHGLAYIPKA